MSRARGTNRRRLWRVWPLLCASFLASPLPAARADDTATRKSAAQDLFNDAMALRASGNPRDALAKFRVAHDLGNTPTTGLELGRTLASMGKLVEAFAVLSSVERLPSRDSKVSISARSEAAMLAEQVRARTPTLIVRVTGSAAADARVELDGMVIGAEAVGVPSRVDPVVPHRAIARSNGVTDTADFKLDEGETRTITLSVDAPPGAHIPAEPSGPAKAPESSRLASPAVYVPLATSAAAAVVGGVFGVLAFDKVAVIRQSCVQHVCTSSDQSNIDSAQTRATISNVSFLVSGVALAVGLTVMLWPRSAATATAHGFTGRF
jgi:hypothetical protein